MLAPPLLALLLAVPAAAATSELPPKPPLPTVREETPQQLVREMETLVEAARGLQEPEARELEERLKGYGPRFERLGTRAVPLLSWYVVQTGRPREVRLYAAAFLGLIGDPGAFRALRKEAESPSEDAGLRAAAVQALGSLRLQPSDLRPALDALLAPSVPAPVRREALVQLAGVGTADPVSVRAAARALGRAPEGADAAE
ncbi:MAG: HEAT repeat domain-containing protein, partial [Elusimicrobia bacterium]|nr:HEAT repeat domain-containing protein [Elusimicrobiota bacterium]